MVISLKGTEHCSTCPAQRAFLFEVIRRGKGTPSEFRIANDTAQIDQAYVVNTGRAAIVGRIQSSTSVVNLVDVNTGKLLDEFWCFDPSVSPSNRFVAYAKVFPLHFVPGVSYEYLAYDLTETPAGNRTPQNRNQMTDPYDVGWPVYPAGALNTSGDNILSDQSMAHLISSGGIFWLAKSDRFAFVDYWEGVSRLVVADISRGVQQPKVSVYPIDTAAVVDMGACKSKLAPSDFEALSKDPTTSIRVTNIQVSSKDPHALRLSLSPQPCLATTTLDVRVAH